MKLIIKLKLRKKEAKKLIKVIIPGIVLIVCFLLKTGKTTETYTTNNNYNVYNYYFQQTQTNPATSVAGLVLYT